MDGKAIVQSVMQEIIQLGVERLMESRYFTELRHYGLGDDALAFFTVHMVADKEHTARSAELVARNIKSPRDERLVRESAQYMVRIKLSKFDGIYENYA
jgi:pyrroloquinoline quinone (PQQ) biosynthesis protein C